MATKAGCKVGVPATRWSAAALVGLVAASNDGKDNDDSGDAMVSVEQKTKNIQKQVDDAKAELERCYARNSGVRAALRRYESAVTIQKIHLASLSRG